MASFLCDLVKQYVERMINRAITEARHVFCFTCIVKDFEEERARLEQERVTIGQRVKVAMGKDKDIQANVGFWEEEIGKLNKVDIKTKQKCFFGFCPDCVWRYKRGKELANNLEDIKRLIEKGEKLENIELPRRLPDVERYSSQTYISFKSRELKYKELLEALKDDNNYITGLQGMGGTGKTTLAKEVGKELKQSEQFAHVIDTTVSCTPAIKKIQDDIAGPLGLKWEDCNESDRPKKLWSRLTNGEKILLIMDDVWDQDPPLDFEAIGIPKHDNHKGCRVLVTSRSKQTFNKMDCDKIIELYVLSEDDAWIMFQMYAGICSSSSKNLISKGLKIAKECKQLPVAIAVIASCLKGQQDRVHEWDVILKSLKKPVSMQDVDDDMVEVYKCLKFSYDYLKDEKAKELFLLCSLFQEDEEILVETLVRICIGMGIFRDDYCSYNDARNQVVVAKNKLIDSCLLLEVNERNVKMHDLVRDAAQWIGNKEFRAVNLSDKIEKSMIERETSIRHLLCEGDIMDMFSCKLNGSKLETLIVFANGCQDCECMEVPSSFFENLVKLRTFNFSFRYKLPLSLAHSIQSLTNIRSISIDTVDLGDISALGNLPGLETLDLINCTINELPSEIAKLEKLKLLFLISCLIRMNNPFDTIERCSSLEELHFIRSFNDFCQEITLPELQRYRIGKGCWGKLNDSISKYVYFDVSYCNFFFSKETFKYFMQTTNYLWLNGMKGGWRNLMPEIVPIELGMNDIVELSLSWISKLECLIDNIGSQVPNVLSKLVVLELARMGDLEELFSGSISFDSLKNLEKLSIMSCEHLQSLFKCKLNLCNLKTIILLNCPLLVSLFQLSTSRSLVLLEILRIENCEGLENIIVDESRELESREKIDGDDNDNKSHGSMFPKLKFLYIEGCPLLEYILPILSAQDLPILKDVRIERCDGLKYIFEHHMELGSLTKLQLCYLPSFIGIFRECYHSMSSCAKGSSSTSNCGSKAQEELGPIKCSIFSCCHGNKFRHKLGSTATPTIPLVDGDQPQQDYLESNSYCSNIWECPQCLSRRSKILRNIKQIKLLHVPKIKWIFIPSVLLELLIVMNCDELKHIIIDTMDHGSDGNSWGNVFPKLRNITVDNCVQLEYIFEYYIDDHQNHTEIHLQLPALENFLLRNMPSLVAMCPGQYHTTLSPLKKLVLSECPQVAIKSIADFMTRHSTTRSMDGTIIKELSGNIEHFISLEKMVVKNTKVESFFCLDEVSEQQLTLRLAYLELQDLPVMTCLFLGPKNSFSLQNLDVLKIVGCEKLEIIFSTSIARCLPHLRHLIIKECKELKHIIEDDLENIKGSNYVASGTSFPMLELLVVINCTKLKYLFPTSVSKELPELEALMIREADELEEIFKSEGDDQEVEIPYLNVVAFVNLPSLCQTQGIQFQDVENRFVQNCPKFSLTSTSRANSISDINDINFSSEHELREDFLNLFKQLQESESDDSCSEYSVDSSESDDSCSEYSVDSAVEIEVEAASGHGSTSSQIQMKQTLEADPEFVEDNPDLEIASVAILPTNSKELMKEQTLDQQCLMSQEHPLGETNITSKHSLENNLEGSTSEKTVETTLSTLSGTRNKRPIQSVVPKQKGIEISVKEGNTSANAKPIPMLTHLELVRSSSGPIVTFEHKSSSQEYGDGQTAIPSLSNSTINPLTLEDFDNDQGSLNDNPLMKCLEETKGISIQESSTLQKTVATTLTTVSETRKESTIQLAAPKQKVIKLSFEDTTTIANAKTITSPTHSEPNISSSGPLVTYEHKTSSHEYCDVQIAIPSFSISTKDVDLGNSQETNNQESKSHNHVGIEVETASVHDLTSSQELMNGQSTNLQHPVREIDTRIKPSQGNNLEGSKLGKIEAASLSIISGTKNETDIQLVAPIQKGIEISVEEGSTSTHDKTIRSSTHLEDRDGKIRIPSFSTVNTKPPATKDVDIGDSQETTHQFYDSAMKDINKLIEEDPLLALEKLLTGQVPISSIQILLQELKTLMDSSSNLDHLVSNQESKSKLISLLHQLNEHQGMLTSELKDFVEKVQNFFNDNIIKHTTSQQVFNKHNQLLALKTNLMNKLWSAKSTQTHIDSESSTANAQIHELSLQIDDLKSVVNKCDVQKEKLKAECTEWAQQSKELVSALASSAVDVREAELARNFASEGFANLKSSFPTF